MPIYVKRAQPFIVLFVYRYVACQTFLYFFKILWLSFILSTIDRKVNVGLHNVFCNTVLLTFYYRLNILTMEKYTLYWNITIYSFSSFCLSYLYNMNEKFLFSLFNCRYNNNIFVSIIFRKNCYKIRVNCMGNIHIIYIELLSTNLVETNLHIFT